MSGSIPLIRGLTNTCVDLHDQVNSEIDEKSHGVFNDNIDDLVDGMFSEADSSTCTAGDDIHTINNGNKRNGGPRMFEKIYERRQIEKVRGNLGTLKRRAEVSVSMNKKYLGFGETKEMSQTKLKKNVSNRKRVHVSQDEKKLIQELIEYTATVDVNTENDLERRTVDSGEGWESKEAKSKDGNNKEEAKVVTNEQVDIITELKPGERTKLMLDKLLEGADKKHEQFQDQLQLSISDGDDKSNDDSTFGVNLQVASTSRSDNQRMFDQIYQRRKIEKVRNNLVNLKRRAEASASSNKKYLGFGVTKEFYQSKSRKNVETSKRAKLSQEEEKLIQELVEDAGMSITSEEA